MKFKTPKSKHQTSKKHQAPNSNPECAAARCLGVWDLEFIWCLVFDVWYLGMTVQLTLFNWCAISGA
jgi:hypothetical protein